MTFTPKARAILSAVAGIGLLASLSLYAYSFLQDFAPPAVLWYVLLTFDLAVLAICFRLAEPRAYFITSAASILRGALPSWAFITFASLCMLFFGHFVLMVVSSWPGAPRIIDGQYVIMRGKTEIIRTLTKPAYLALIRLQTRMLSSAFIAMSFSAACYWIYGENQ